MGTQQRILYAIQQYIDEHNYPPSVREIGEMVGLASPSTVHGHLFRLQRKGLIEWEPTRPRTLRVKHHVQANWNMRMQSADKTSMESWWTTGVCLCAVRKTSSRIRVTLVDAGAIVKREKEPRLMGRGFLYGDVWGRVGGKMHFETQKFTRIQSVSKKKNPWKTRDSKINIDLNKVHFNL